VCSLKLKLHVFDLFVVQEVEKVEFQLNTVNTRRIIAATDKLLQQISTTVAATTAPCVQHTTDVRDALRTQQPLLGPFLQQF